MVVSLSMVGGGETVTTTQEVAVQWFLSVTVTQ